MTGFPLFDDFFQALWPSYDPFPWQSMLAEQVATGTWPKALELPTAAGKTACIDAAVYALAAQADKPVSQRTAPRRIWFVVDRRIVVDEAFDRASAIARKLVNATEGPLKAVADRLFQISGIDGKRGGKPLAVARLRGGILRDDNWARLPSQPAVITSTVDQLGSRLLFRGYGWSKLAAPIFAGLAAHDSLILLDEAHCSVPFLQTLRNIETYRGEKWAETPIRTPFAFAILSATPPTDLPPEVIFPGHERREAALDHVVLQQRLQASKPALLERPLKAKSNEADPLVGKAADQALGYVNEDKHRIAVIVNRVRTAKDIAKTLRQKNPDIDIVLLTGRLRAYERDKLVERWKPFLTAAQPEEPGRPVILVSTQCIEVGADFSFDGLVTEAASLDALRQRFGRLNRMGNPGAAPATVLIREADTKSDRNDPIYGKAIAECWLLLTEKADTIKNEKNGQKQIDFGFSALDEKLADVESERLISCVAPRPNAPFLFPAYLDLLCQTAPVPQPEPDIGLFLHGIGRGIPEVRIVFRTDLPVEKPDDWPEILALCPPSSGEMLSAPLHAIRAWLADATEASENASDVEGGERPTEENAGTDRRIRPVLVWRGRDRSLVRRRASAVRADDVVAVPAGYGFPNVGQSQPAEAMGADQLDIWEPARSVSGKPKALRLHRRVLQPWIECPAIAELVSRAEAPAIEDEDIRAAVDAVVSYIQGAEDEPSAPPRWLTDLLRLVRDGRLETHPGKGLILFERGARGRSAEPDLFADDDDLLSAGDTPMSLADHSAKVDWAVERIATRCLPDGFLAPLRRAAYWHDVGKLDDRFQVLLYEGDEVAAAVGEPRAKSPDLPASPARRRAIREASGLPAGFRHEMLSYELAERLADLPGDDAIADLILHLIASHHGYARPFAPIVQDSEPPGVSGHHDGIPIALTAADRAKIVAPHAPGSGLPDRFWRLTRQYGWWGLAYLEAVLRLADWYGSLSVEEVGIERSPKLPLAASATRTHADEREIVLTGIDGANPLGFLAALGALSVVHQGISHDGPRLSWKRSATWQPVLTVPGRLNKGALCELIVKLLQNQTANNSAWKHAAECWDYLSEAERALKEKEQKIEKRQQESKKEGLIKEKIKKVLSPIKEQLKALKQQRENRLYEWASTVRPELLIRDLPKCTESEWRGHAARFVEAYASSERESLDFLAAFASDACLEYNKQQKKWQLELTPFCFVRGSGHQFFMATVRELMREPTAERVRSVLFDAWTYTDEGLSLRWDPVEDRRYALLDRDPTASGNKPRTLWMANLLAYRALGLFTSAPGAGGLRTGGWDRSTEALTWPIWEVPVPPDAIRSLLLLDELAVAAPDRSNLQARGIVAAYRARRIRVGSGANFKINFSPARAV